LLKNNFIRSTGFRFFSQSRINLLKKKLPRLLKTGKGHKVVFVIALILRLAGVSEKAKGKEEMSSVMQSSFRK